MSIKKKLLHYLISKSLKKERYNFFIYFICIYILFYNKKIRTTSKTVGLAFEKPRFDLDINSMSIYSELEILKIPLNLSTSIGSYFLPKELQSQKNYHIELDMDYESSKKVYFHFLESILLKFCKILNIKFLIVGNFDYWEHQEWSRVLAKFEIPTVCIYRESYSWDSKTLWRKNLYKDYTKKLPPIEICVFGAQAKTWMKTLPILDANKIHVTGSPRTDFYPGYTHKILNTKKDFIVLFDYFSQNYGSVENCSHHKFVVMSLVEKKCQICNLVYNDISGEVISRFINISRDQDFNHYKFIIKTKNKSYTNFLEDTFSEELKNTSNISITGELSFSDILSRSKIIIGNIRSTAVIESFISNADIILPLWDNQKNSIIDNKSNLGLLGIKKIINSENFEKYVSDSINSEESISQDAIKERMKIIEEGIYKIDGLSSKRVQNIVESLIK